MTASAMHPFLAICAVLAGLYALHRLALWMEARGWIYYVKRKPSGTAIGSAVLEVQKIVQPEKRHVLEAIRQEKSAQDDASGSDDPER